MHQMKNIHELPQGNYNSLEGILLARPKFFLHGGNCNWKLPRQNRSTNHLWDPIPTLRKLLDFDNRKEFADSRIPIRLAHRTSPPLMAHNSLLV